MDKPKSQKSRYTDFIRKDVGEIDHTFEGDGFQQDTDTPSTLDDNGELESLEMKPKSFGLRVSDWWKNNGIATVIVAVLIVIFNFVFLELWDHTKDILENRQGISANSTKIDDLKNDQDKIKKNVTDLDINYKIFRAINVNSNNDAS